MTTIVKAHLVTLGAALVIAGACRSAAPPPIRFAPPQTDVTRLRTEFALTDEERRALSPEAFRTLTQEQVDQIYLRLSSGPIPDGPFRGDLFFPRDRSGRARIRDLADPTLPLTAHIAALRVERLGRALWKGKAFFRSQGILRNRIDELTILKPFIRDDDTIPKLTFDGKTTWLLFPAALSCGPSRLDGTRRAILIDYSRGPTLEGYREVPDKLAGPEGLNIFDEVRVIRRGFYLGRAYFGQRFALNFTLLDPAVATDAPPSTELQEECHVTPAAGREAPPVRANPDPGAGGDSGDRRGRLRPAGAPARHGAG